MILEAAPKLGDEKVRVEETGTGRKLRVRLYRFVPVHGDVSNHYGYWDTVATAVMSTEAGALDLAASWRVEALQDSGYHVTSNPTKEG